MFVYSYPRLVRYEIIKPYKIYWSNIEYTFLLFEDRKQYRVHYREHQTKEERPPETIYFKSWNELRDQEDDQRIDYKGKEPDSDDINRQRQ